MVLIDLGMFLRLVMVMMVVLLLLIQLVVMFLPMILKGFFSRGFLNCLRGRCPVGLIQAGSRLVRLVILVIQVFLGCRASIPILWRKRTLVLLILSRRISGL